MEVKPFKVRIDDDVLDDLRARLARTRWPDFVPAAGWDYGTDWQYMRELVRYWLDGFDWRKQERYINSFSHFPAIVAPATIHFVHERGKGPNPMPLIVTHGWPSTFYEILKIVPLLTDPASHGGDAHWRGDVPRDFRFPREWAERCYNVQHWTEIPRGGHFVAFEEPQLLAEDIGAFFRPLRTARTADKVTT